MAINKVEANGQTLIDLTNDTATANDVIEGKTLHLASGAVATGTYRPSDEIEARLEATVGHSSKNLYQITVDTQTIDGVTFNVDKANGTITVNGTSPSNNEATLKQSFIVTKNLAGKKYFSASLNQVGSSSTFDAYIYDSTARRLITKWDGTTTTPRLYGTESQEVLLIEGHQLLLHCRIFKGQTVSNLIYKPMIRDGSISDDTFEPYVIPTDEAKQDKPVVLYDAGESSVGVHSVTGFSNLTQYSELHITLFAPLSGNEPAGYTHTIVYPFILSNNPANQATMFDCWVTAYIDGGETQKRVGIGIQATNTTVNIIGEVNEQDGSIDNIPSNHYIYIKRIVGIP